MKTGLNDFINNLNANKKTANVREFIELVNNCALDIEVIKKEMSRINTMKIKQTLPLFIALKKKSNRQTNKYKHRNR